MTAAAAPESFWWVFILLGAIYFLPTLIAALRLKPRVMGVFVVNLTLGWSVVGWFVAFIWACGR